MGGPASHTALIICHQSKSNSSTDGRKKAVTRGGQTDPLKFSVSSSIPQRIRPSQLSSDGGMAVLAALMASRRGRTRWGRAAGLRAPRLGACAGRGQLLLRVFSQGLGVAASLSTSTRRHLDLRHGEGPLDLVWWLGHHAYPRLTGESSTASFWAAGMAGRQRLFGGQVRRKVHAGLRFGIPEDI